MQWFLIILAIGLAASDKLDRTYLPPPGAHLAGGILGSNDAPLEPPHHSHSEPGPVIGGQGAQPNFGINGEPLNFGDKIPKVPVTTTSYAFSQTTTYPSGEGFETTAFPINPVTGLPIQLEQGLPNFPYGPSQGQQNVQNLPGYTQTQAPTYGTNIQPSFTTTQAPTYGANIQPGFGLQGPTSAPVNIGSPGYNQFANQPLNQYQGQNEITPAGAPQIPGSVYPGQNQGQLQFPGGQSNTQGFLPTGASDNQRLDQHPGQKVVNTGGVVQIPGSNQGLVQYPGGQTVKGQQGFVPTTGSPINLQPGGNQSGVNYDGSQGPISQGTYTGQPINEQNLGGTQPTQTSYQNQEPINIGGIPSQYPTGNQNYGSTVPTGSENAYQPGSTPSTIPSTYINGVSSTTPDLGAPPSTSSYSPVQPVYRPERPQAAADRNAVILNYENVRTPNGYSYSFDTSNGIHADESGIVDNGTKAQGSYSYIGDDGKLYSVIYTADENGFQPRGDHLPTPPPIPEAIQRVIEQADRDKAAGIVHDGSYDEAKYGDHNYRGTANRPRPQNQGKNQFDNDQYSEARDDLIKPIAGIKDEKYNEGVTKDQFNNNLPITDTQKSLNGKLASTRPANQRIGENNVQDVSVGNGRVSDDFHSPRGDFDGNKMPIAEDKINHSNNYGAKKQEPAGRRPGSRGNNFSSHGAIDSDESNLPASKNRRPSEPHPISGGVKDVTEKYPSSNVDVGTTDKSETGGDGFYNGEVREIDSSRPNVPDGSGENINTNYNSVTGAPKMGNKIQTLRQRIKGNGRPDSTGNRNTQNNNGRLQGETFTQGSTDMPSFSDYFKKGIANQQETQQGYNGYHYQQPNIKFEQNTFPTRFSPQEVPTTQTDQRKTEYVEGTTRKPFMTPNVYYQNNRNNQSTPNRNDQNGRNRQSAENRYNENKSTTRRPYTTPFNTDTSYTDYDDSDYATDQDIGDDRIQSTRKPADKRVTSRPYQSTQTKSTPQNVPSGQRTRVDQNYTVTPGRKIENSGTESSGYTYRPTTQMPSHTSRFGNTEIPRRMKPQERRPTNTVPGSTSTVGRPVTTKSPSGIGQLDNKYQTTGPNFKYPDANVGSGYPTTGSFPGTGSMRPGVSTPRDFYTSTYGPTQDYFSTTPVPPTSGYIQGSGSQVPGTSASYQPPREETFHTGYHYGPPKTGALNLDGPGFFTPTGTSGVFPTSPTGTYQTTYQQGSDGFPSTTFVPITPGSQNTFTPSQPGTFAPETSPTGTYTGNYQNGPSTPDYDTTIVSLTPGGKPGFVYPGSPSAQETTGYENGPTRPTYSTTESPSTIGTTPGSFIPTGSIGPNQDYSTTYRPGFQPTQDTFVGGPVDGFGRPIVTVQGGSHPGFIHPTQGPTGPVNNVGPNFGGNEQAVTYPGDYDQTRVIGEDFSGPKQPQRYDPKTGYHYK